MIIDGKNLLYFVWFVTILSLFFFIPKNKIRLAWVAFLFKQVLTWPLGLFVVNMGWIQYPIRFFENANYASFTFEFFIYPVMCIYLNVYFPSEKSLLSTSDVLYLDLLRINTCGIVNPTPHLFDQVYSLEWIFDMDNTLYYFLYQPPVLPVVLQTIYKRFRPSVDR